MTARAAFLFLAALLPAIAGCSENMWWEYRDDPYLADMARRGDQAILSNINSPYSDTRQTALRLAATQAAEARRDGRKSDAERLEGIVIRRYKTEKDNAVKLCIVRICAPACGPGGQQMPDFLRGRIAAGEFPGHAALALAALKVPGAAGDVIPLTRHPAPEVRYQAATALVLIGDPKGAGAVNRTLDSMRRGQGWPEAVEGVPLDEARTNLARRAAMTFGPR